MKNPFFLKKLMNYFFKGILLIVPTVVTLYFFYKLFMFIDNIIPYNPFPGFGVIVILFLLTFLGIIGNTMIANPFKKMYLNFLKKAPLIKLVYNSIKDLVSAFVGEKKRFHSPVLVKLSKDTTVQKLGFITNDNLESIGIKEKVAVYFPHSYAFSGNLFIVDTKYITPLDVKSGDVMKLIISGGVINSGSKNI